MQSVADFYQDDPDVIAHGEQKLLEVLCLSGCLVAKDAAADFCQSIDNHGYLRAEDVLYVLYGIVGVLYYIVQEGGANARGTKPHLLACYARHGYGMHDVRLARQTPYSFVCLPRKVERLSDDVHLLAVR